MILLTDYQGREHAVAVSAIAHVAEAGPSSAWHGIRSFVRLFDGKTTLEVRETLAEVLSRMAKAG